MAARKTPEERALADVEKAIKAHDVALEKAEAAQKKADEAVAVANRADRELDWMAHHPDLPEDFDLDAFRRSLAAPFADEPEFEETPVEVANEAAAVVDAVTEKEADAIGDAIESGEIDPDALEEPEPVKETPASIDEADDEDDPWAADD